MWPQLQVCAWPRCVSIRIWLLQAADIITFQLAKRWHCSNTQAGMRTQVHHLHTQGWLQRTVWCGRATLDRKAALPAALKLPLFDTWQGTSLPSGNMRNLQGTVAHPTQCCVQKTSALETVLLTCTVSNAVCNVLLLCGAVNMLHEAYSN
jgi:hypothetical protein